MDSFETGDVTQRWIAPQSSDNPPCGTWAVVADGATNHVYSQTSTACTSSNPSWAAGGNISWTDMRLQVRVRFDSAATTSTKITIGIRYNDPKDIYFIEYTNDGKMKIRERTASSTTDVISLASKMAGSGPERDVDDDRAQHQGQHDQRVSRHRSDGGAGPDRHRRRARPRAVSPSASRPAPHLSMTFW